jgi:DNA-binding NarL/FixJ family response regulator
MRLIVFTVSPAFAEFIEAHLHLPVDLRPRLEDPAVEPNCLHLLHLTGMEDACFEWLQQNVPARCRLAALCSDRPNIREMLEGVKLGVRAYCNSYMAAIHYRQMLHLLESGQSWFPPQLLEQTFELARRAADQRPETATLDALTRREREIALAVGEGKSNREIAAQFDISEPTVKTHLTNIFRKLEIKDRIGLVLLLKQA